MGFTHKKISRDQQKVVYNSIKYKIEKPKNKNKS